MNEVWTCPDCGVSWTRSDGTRHMRCTCGKRAVWLDPAKLLVHVIQRPNGPHMSCVEINRLELQDVEVHLESA